MRLSFFLISIISTTLLTACGGGYNPDLAENADIPPWQKVGGSPVEIVQENPGSLTFDNGSIEGVGQIRMTTNAQRRESAFNYQIDFELQPNESLTLVTHARGDLSGGVRIRFSRGSGQELKVDVPSDPEQLDISNLFAKIRSDQIVKVMIDVHNDHGASPHILFWDQFGKELGEDSIQGQGASVHWGFILDGAKLLRAERSGPRKVHN